MASEENCVRSSEYECTDVVCSKVTLVVADDSRSVSWFSVSESAEGSGAEECRSNVVTSWGQDLVTELAASV